MDQGFNMVDGGYIAGSHASADREVRNPPSPRPDMVRVRGIRFQGAAARTQAFVCPGTA